MLPLHVQEKKINRHINTFLNMICFAKYIKTQATRRTQIPHIHKRKPPCLLQPLTPGQCPVRQKVDMAQEVTPPHSAPDAEGQPSCHLGAAQAGMCLTPGLSAGWALSVAAQRWNTRAEDTWWWTVTEPRFLCPPGSSWGTFLGTHFNVAHTSVLQI